mmetsp:Transcript_50151/g.107457  ORF Transcript_50151/g.107457 Transcript_50151/m.107457 type:complete len:162 (+) Transcript_50151:21-506(+)
MWRPDAGYCVATTAEWGEHPDDVEYMRMLKAMPKKVLKKREMTVKDVDLAKACAKQGKVHFSICCWHLSEFSKSSGVGEAASSLIAVFYESKDERKVLNCFSSAGIDLESAEAVPVDPNSSLEYEQKVMYNKECLYLEDTYSWEEGQPMSAADLKSRFKMK